MFPDSGSTQLARDEDTLRSRVREALDVDDAPTVIRYRKGSLPEPMPALRTVGEWIFFFTRPGDPSSIRFSGRACAPDAMEAARRRPPTV